MSWFPLSTIMPSNAEQLNALKLYPKIINRFYFWHHLSLAFAFQNHQTTTSTTLAVEFKWHPKWDVSLGFLECCGLQRLLPGIQHIGTSKWDASLGSLEHCWACKGTEHFSTSHRLCYYGSQNSHWIQMKNC